MRLYHKIVINITKYKYKIKHKGFKQGSDHNEKFLRGVNAHRVKSDETHLHTKLGYYRLKGEV